MGNEIVKYGRYTPEAAARDEKEGQRLGAFLKLKPGEHKLRVLPPPVGKESPLKTVFQHGFEVAGQYTSFACPRHEAKRPCPACMMFEKLRKTGNPADVKLAEDYQAKKQFFANVIDRSAPEKGPQVLRLGWTIHNALTKLYKNADAGGDFSDPLNGYDLLITRTGTGKNDTEYTVFPARKSSPLASRVENGQPVPDGAQMQAWIDGQPDLDLLSRIQEAADIEKMMSGEDAGQKADNAKDAGGGSAPEVVSGKARPSKRTAQDDIEDAEVDEFDRR